MEEKTNEKDISGEQNINNHIEYITESAYISGLANLEFDLNQQIDSYEQTINNWELIEQQIETYKLNNYHLKYYENKKSGELVYEPLKHKPIGFVIGQQQEKPKRNKYSLRKYKLLDEADFSVKLLSMKQQLSIRLEELAEEQKDVNSQLDMILTYKEKNKKIHYFYDKQTDTYDFEIYETKKDKQNNEDD